MTTRYVLFLRGINVGKKKVPMPILQKKIEGLGFKNVKTLLNSGNVIFESSDKIEEVKKKTNEQLSKTFPFPIPTIVRQFDEILALINSRPFKDIPITPMTRLYVTFLPATPTTNLKQSFESKDKNFKILKVTDGEVISVLTLSGNVGTTLLMDTVEGKYGKSVTTRSWKTIIKLADL